MTERKALTHARYSLSFANSRSRSSTIPIQQQSLPSRGKWQQLSSHTFNTSKAGPINRGKGHDEFFAHGTGPLDAVGPKIQGSKPDNTGKTIALQLGICETFFFA